MSSICFVSLNNFATLSGADDVSHIGGAEVQQTYVARALARRGWRVSFVTLDHGQADGAEYDGIRVFKAYRPEAGIRRLRFLHPRWTGLCAAMKRSGANVYYQRTAANETGQACLWCRHNGKKFVYGVASDRDCDPRLPLLDSAVERRLYRYAIRHADAIVAQTRRQRELLEQFNRRDAVVIPSCRPLPPLPAEGIARPTGRARALWLGRFHEAKRPELCLELAEKCPWMDFDIVGTSSSNSRAGQEYLRRAAALSNVVLHDYQPHAAVCKMYERCSVLLSTSVDGSEGFPNTFLEAWSYARPVVCTVDPDAVVSRNGLGLVAQREDELADALERILRDDWQWHAAARAARDYVAKHHSVDAVADAYEKLLRFDRESSGK
jgi:glycosyltransferase involved in cell wall biosynthesis